MRWLLGDIVFILAFAQSYKLRNPVYPEPELLPRVGNVTVREGAKALLPCAVRHVGTRQVTWRKLGQHHFLTLENFIWVKDNNLDLDVVRLMADITEWNLILQKASKTDSGIYQCQVSATTTLTKHIQLNVVSPPPSLIAMSGKRYVEQGQPIHLYCNTTVPIAAMKGNVDHAKLRVDWFKDGDNIRYSKYRHVVITDYYLSHLRILVSELHIDRSSVSDTGLYICRCPLRRIESHQLTVLFADSTNVKRGTSPYRCSAAVFSWSMLRHVLHALYRVPVPGMAGLFMSSLFSAAALSTLSSGKNC